MTACPTVAMRRAQEQKGQCIEAKRGKFHVEEQYGDCGMSPTCLGKNAEVYLGAGSTMRDSTLGESNVGCSGGDSDMLTPILFYMMHGTANSPK